MAVCSSLRDIESGEYFYEALLEFSWDGPKYGRNYKKWVKKRRKAMESGDEIYFVGALRDEMRRS